MKTEKENIGQMQPQVKKFLRVRPINLEDANVFVKNYHRHNLPVAGSRFAIAAEKDGIVVGVAICGRPVNRNLDNGLTLEVYRVATDGTKNATSFLYTRCRRIGQLMGYEKIITYTLQSESGSSLRAVGATQIAMFEGRQWNNHKNGIRKKQAVYDAPKIRWEL